MKNLALMLEKVDEDEGIEKDVVEAVALCGKAIDAGNTRALLTSRACSNRGPGERRRDG